MGYPFTMPRGGAPVGLPYGQPGQPGQPYGGRRRGTGLVVGLVVALVLVLGGIGGTVWWLAGDHHDDSTAQDPAPTTSSSPSTIPSTSPSTSPSPSSSPGISPPSPTPTPTPTPPTTPAFPSSGPVSYREWAHRWNFRLGSVQLAANFVQGHDYPTCAGVEKNGGLTSKGCQRASTLVYHARSGALAMTHLLLTMRSAHDATAAAKQGVVSSDDWIARPASWVVPQGTWNLDATGRYLVITLVTHKASVSDGVASDYLHYGNADISGALAFR